MLTLLDETVTVLAVMVAAPICSIIWISAFLLPVLTFFGIEAFLMKFIDQKPHNLDPDHFGVRQGIFLVAAPLLGLVTGISSFFAFIVEVELPEWWPTDLGGNELDLNAFEVGWIVVKVAGSLLWQVCGVTAIIGGVTMGVVLLGYGIMRLVRGSGGSRVEGDEQGKHPLSNISLNLSVPWQQARRQPSSETFALFRDTS